LVWVQLPSDWYASRQTVPSEDAVARISPTSYAAQDMPLTEAKWLSLWYI